MSVANEWDVELNMSMFFSHDSKKTNYWGRVFINGRQPNPQEHEDCSWCQRRKTRLLWLMWPSNQRILKDIRASSLRCSLKFFGRPSSSSLPCLPSQPMAARVITELHYKVWFTHILCIVFSLRLLDYDIVVEQVELPTLLGIENWTACSFSYSDAFFGLGGGCLGGGWPFFKPRWLQKIVR